MSYTYVDIWRLSNYIVVEARLPQNADVLPNGIEVIGNTLNPMDSFDDFDFVLEGTGLNAQPIGDHLKLSVKPTESLGTIPPLLIIKDSIVNAPRGNVPAVGILTRLNGG